MSQLFEVNGIKSEGYFYSKKRDELGNAGYSGAVGLDRTGGEDAWRIIRYSLTFPNQENGIKTTKVLVDSLTFTPPNSVSSFYVIGSGAAATEQDYDVYGLFSTENNLSHAALCNKTGSFKIINFKGMTSVKQITCSIENPIEITDLYDENDNQKTWYLYVFTKNTGGATKQALCHWTNGNVGGVLSKVTGNGEIITYTQLSSPSELKITTTQTIIVPNGTVKLQWDIPQQDQENYFSGYLLNWQCGEKSGTSFINKNEHEFLFQADALPRGNKLKFSIASKHSEDQRYNSVFKECAQEITINSLPAAPVISFETPQTISSQNPMILKPEILSEDIDNQSLSFYWRFDSNGSFIKYVANDGLMLQNDKIIELYAHDGLERGESRIYTIGEAPIDNLYINNPPVLPEASECTYDLGSDILKINPSEQPSDIGWSVRLFIKSSIGTIARATSWKDYDSNGTLSNYYFDDNFNGPFESIWVEYRLKDGYQDVSESAFMEIRPVISGLGDSENPVEFLSKIYIEDLSNWLVSTDSFKNIAYTSENGKIIISNPNDLNPNTIYPIDIIASKERRQIWLFKNLYTITKNFVKFNNGPNLPSINPFEVWLDNNSDTYNIDINISDAFDESPQIQLVLNNKEKTIDLISSPSSSDNTWNGYIEDRKAIFDWETDRYGFSEFVGKKQVQAWLQYEFDGDIIKSPTVYLPLDFDYIKNSPKPSFVNQVYENYTPFIELSDFSVATQDNLEFVLQVDRNDGKGFVDYDTQMINYPDEAQPTLNGDQLELPKISNTINFSKIGEIADNNKRQWQIITRLVSNKNCYKLSELLETSVVQHSAPTNFIITNSTWTTDNSNQGYALLDFDITLNGDPTELEIDYTKASGLGELEKVGRQLKYTPSNTEQSPYSIQIKVTTKYGNTEKESFSNYFTIYPDGPTVAYRPHYLGINTTVFDERALLQIAPGGDTRNKIYLKSTKGSSILIDLETKEILGAILDCGTWDKI